MPEIEIDKPKLALQTWTLRHELRVDSEKTLAGIHRIGFEYLELAGTGRKPLREFSELCNKYQLKIVGVHQPPLTSARFDDMINEIKHQAKACGAKYVTVTLDPLQRGSEAAYLRYAELCSRAGDELGKERIKLCYRFYHYDLTPIKHASHGRSGLDIFIEQTSAQHLLFELDTYFMSRAGVHHETIIEKCGGRCKLLHLCDIDDQARQATVGRGVISWTDLMHSLKGDSCPNVFIIENDTREGFASIRESFHYARKHFHWADPAQ